MTAYKAYLTKRNCHPVILFWEAFCYAEMRFAEERVGKIFVSFCEKREGGSLLITSIPQVVEDYALDCLAGRATPMAFGTKQLEEHDEV